MKASRIAAVLLLVGAVVRAGPEEDLLFAQMLGRRGLDEMALEVLDRLERSSDPKAKRFGRFGKAVLTKDRASVARARFLADLEEGRKPRVSRDGVLKLYADAKPAIEEYVQKRADDYDARFLLGELLQEYAEFLTGADYPPEMAEDAAKLVSENKDQAGQLFEQAIAQFTQVAEKMQKKLEEEFGDEAEIPFDDTTYVRASWAAYKAAKANMRWALLFPKGPNLIFRSDTAIEQLDAFYNEHYNDTYGGLAMLDLGRIHYERAMRMGDRDDAINAINYFTTLVNELKEDPQVPETSNILAQAFYWHARMCNALARKEGALKKAEPVFFDNTIRSAGLMRQKLQVGIENPWALKAQLEIAEALASQGRFDEAVSTAGEVLGTARKHDLRKAADNATGKLTSWVASAAGGSALDVGLLYEIGESLANQGRVANAITFFEKAVAAAANDEDRSRFAHPARLRMAQIYLADKRYYIAAMVGMALANEFLKSANQDDSAFEDVASEACNVARLAWKAIADKTKRSADRQRYDAVRSTFQAKFPNHPENSDAAFSSARDKFNDKEYAAAAAAFHDISPGSRNYWRAMRLLPECYRRLALAEEDEAKAAEWHAKCLEVARQVVGLAKKKPDEPQAKRALSTAELYVAVSQAALGKWADALRSIDAYLAKYPGSYPKRGLEFKVKIDAHIQLGQLAMAEAALADFRKKLPESGYLNGATYSVFLALRNAYDAMGGGKQAVDTAVRASRLLETWIDAQPKIDWKKAYLLGDVMGDAHRYREAGDAYEAAASMVSGQNERQAFTLRAAKMKFRAAKERARGGTRDKEILKLFEETRKNFTDFLIPKEFQKRFLKTLADPKKWLSKADWSKIKRHAEALLTAAEVFCESSPPGLDGCWIAIRLLKHLQTFTSPVEDPARPESKKYIKAWWDAAEMMLTIYRDIARRGEGQLSKKAAKDGYSAAKTWIFQYVTMDGPERVKRLKALEAELKVLAR